MEAKLVLCPAGEVYGRKEFKVNIGKTKMIVSGTENAIAVSKIEPCGLYGKRVVSNAVCRTLCNKWMHRTCTKMKKVTCTFARHFIFKRCKDFEEGKKEPEEVLCDEIAFYFIA